MRPRTEALLALGLLVLAATLGALVGGSRGALPATDPRASTFLAGPEGARALLEAGRRLGIAVRRFRERTVRLAELPAPGRQILVVLDPPAPFSPPEVGAVLRFAARSDLLLAGEGAEPIMRCFGYRTERLLDSVPVAAPGQRPGPADPRVGRGLLRTGEREAVDSSRIEDVGRLVCRVPEIAGREVLLRGPGAELAAVRLDLAGGGTVILFGDVAPLRNRSLRATTAGPLILGLFAGRYREIVFEEYHHGFGPGGSLAGAALDWSRRSPWGWAVWQLALVGVLVLLFGAVRFGPARRVITRTRRSPLEHVRALATALAAAEGHDEAIGAMVRGLRRRLAPGLRPSGDWRGWLAGLEGTVHSPRAREALATLRALSEPGQPARNVTLAAHAVEDLWQELKR